MLLLLRIGRLSVLCSRFYLLGCQQNLLPCWQLCQLSGQLVQSYIDVFCKMRIQLRIHDPKQVLIVKFNSDLLLLLCREVELFYSSSLDKVRALAVECKLAPMIRAPYPALACLVQRPLKSLPLLQPSCTWCTFHKTSTHATADCRSLKSPRAAKSLLGNEAPSTSNPPLQPELISLDNPM